MNLTFNQVGNVFVAEFEVTGDFSIHIEKPEGSIAMGQSSVAVVSMIMCAALAMMLKTA